jgi:hypothetical protein
MIGGCLSFIVPYGRKAPPAKEWEGLSQVSLRFKYVVVRGGNVIAELVVRRDVTAVHENDESVIVISTALSVSEGPHVITAGRCVRSQRKLNGHDVRLGINFSLLTVFLHSVLVLSSEDMTIKNACGLQKRRLQA